MGFFFRKSFKCGPIRFNLSKSGIGASVGVKGCRVGLDGKGKAYIGGGRGILRFRQGLGTLSNSTSYDAANGSDFPQELKNITPTRIITAIVCTPLFLYFGALLLAAIFAPKSSFNDILIFLGLTIVCAKPYYDLYPTKSIKYYKKAQKAYSVEDYSTALKNYDLSYCSAKKHDTKYFLSEKLLDCYKNLEDWSGALNFISTHGFIDNSRIYTVECLYHLERWEDLIKYLQSEFDDEEIKKHPATYYCMLSECFIKLGKNQIALDTMLAGPVKSRTMNVEMCTYRYQLAQCYELNGDYNNALKQYNKIYAYDISYKDVEQKILDLTK